jgi:CRISPR/Cas system endoribonuclease Cas6 (RAMP superfamily)
MTDRRKRFFFEKKNQKTFDFFRLLQSNRRRPSGIKKIFAALFFKK